MRSILSLIILISIVSCQWKRDSKNDKYYVISDTTNYSDFQITYDSNDKDDYYSTYDSTYTRRYNQDSKTIKVVLSVADKKRIFEKVKYADILSMPDTLKEKKGAGVMPCFSTEITISFGKIKKRIFYSSYREIADKHIILIYEIIRCVITEILKNKIEVKRLPETDMIYM